MAHCQDEEPEWESSNDEQEFWCESRMGIQETRMMFDSVCFYLSIWPGPPVRPKEEKKYLEHLRSKLFAAIMEYNLLHNDLDTSE